MPLQRPSAERLRQILERQDESRFGPDYQPAILATRREAPTISRPSTARSLKLGRDVHLLALPERAAALLALYHPDLFDLHEQKMLSVDPRPHPLSGHPNAAGVRLPSLRGTVNVADRLGCLSVHPTIVVDGRRASQKKLRVPFPYIGDLLLFLRDVLGSYCVNWTIKAKPEDFLLARLDPAPPRDASAAAYRAWARHEVERVYYADANIRTVKVDLTAIDKHVVANLTHIFGWHSRPVTLAADERADMLTKLDTALEHGLTPVTVINQFMRHYSCDYQSGLAVLYQAIWSRRLRVDLFAPILPDRPLRVERRDVLTEYADWFGRPPCTPEHS